LTALPPHKFVRQVRNNIVIYTYADPTICDCLYVGNQAAYDRYRANVFEKQIANEQLMTAQISQMDWGPWGPGWHYQAVHLHPLRFKRRIKTQTVLPSAEAAR
jgi:hypothetical protein